MVAPAAAAHERGNRVSTHDAPAWDAFQREALAQLGLQPWVVSAHAGASVAVPEVADALPGAVGTDLPGTVAGATVPPALLAALSRAAACDPEQIAGWPELVLLRGNAAAKRALWPRLRRLRVQARQGADLRQ